MVLPEREILAQRFMQGLSRVAEDIVTGTPLAEGSHALAERIKCLEIALAYRGRIRLDTRAVFESDKTNGAGEREFDLGVIEHMKNDHLGALETDAFDAALEGLLVVKEVTDEYDDAAGF